jgi:hypothetical protein
VVTSVQSTQHGQGALEDLFGLVEAVQLETGHAEHGEVLGDQRVVSAQLLLRSLTARRAGGSASPG